MSQEPLRTPRFTASFPNVFKPATVKGDDKGEPKYSLMMIFDKDAQDTKEFKAIQQAVMDALKETWPKAPKEVLKERYLKVFKPGEKCVNQETGERYAGCDDGTVVLRAQSKFKPEVINQKKEIITDENEFYAGCIAISKVTPASFDLQTNKGVTLYLGNVMKVAEGARLSGRRSASSDFEDVEIEEIDMEVEDNLDF